MATIDYPAFFFRQRPDSPLQVAFVAPSSDIDAWARVPTKQTGNIRNFQRAEMPTHVSEVQRFFDNLENASPTAVVIGFDPVRSKNQVKLMDDGGSSLSVDDVKPGITVSGSVLIDCPEFPDVQTTSEVIDTIDKHKEQVTRYILSELEELTNLKQKTLRLLQSEFQQRAVNRMPFLSASAPDDEQEPDEEDTTAIDDQEDTESDQIDELSQLSPEAQKALEGLSPSERHIVIGRLEFVAHLEPDILTELPDTQIHAIYREVCDELKPALLIDGQHRIMGTKKIARIPFLVCALPHALWPELAFQFIVTNRTAKKVQESLLINIVGNSLSRTQRASIEDRLREAGIHVGLIEAVMKVNEDELSPFYNMLSFGIKGEEGFIDAAALRNKVVRLWYERKAPVESLFDHRCQGRLKRDRTDYWKSEELWFEYFIAFWNTVKKRYRGSQVFSTELQDEAKKLPVSKLMTATVLKIFQETILRYLSDHLRQQAQLGGAPVAESLGDVKSFEQLVTNTLRSLEPEFYQGWTITGFDGSKGARADLAEAVRFVIDGTHSVAGLKNMKKPHRLYKGA